MTEFMLKSQNLPFTVSLTIMIMIAFLEGVTALIGFGLSSMIESSIPDFDIDTDLDHSDISKNSILTKTFGWLRIRKVPVLIILIAFLTVFGLCGLFIQSVFVRITGCLLPGLIASFISLFLTLPLVRGITGIIAKIIPKNETEVITEKSFIGQVAVIILGKASKNSPAQAKFKDKFKTTHYVMIEPDIEDEEFVQGDHVLIVKQTNIGYKAIQSPTTALKDIE